MREIGVEPAKLRLLAQVLQELLPHPDQRRGPARREVQAAKQLLPPRLGGGMERLDRVGLVAPDRRDRRLHRGAVRAEPLGEQRQKAAPLLRRRGVEGRDERAGQRDAGGFAAAGKQQVAEGREVGGGHRRLRPAPAQQVAAALGQRVEQVAEERGPALAVGRDGLVHGDLLWSEVEAHPGTTMKMSQRTIGATTVTIAP